MNDYFRNRLYGEPDPSLTPVGPKPSAARRCSLLSEAEEEEHDECAPREMRTCSWCFEILEENDEGRDVPNGGEDHYDGVICSNCDNRGLRY
jgi:hypothetical protein